jgi:alpha-L-fucosidase
MPARLLISASILAALLAGSCGRPTPPPPVDEATLTAQALRRFDENKFGMFIHWGLYAIPAGEWKGQYVRGIGEWIMFRAKIPVKEYEQLASQFNPVKFNAEEWAQLAQDAGMRYMVITAKHHDGFAMYHSKASRYNIVEATPYGKDPMVDLAAACARRGIDFGFYYSQDQDWHEPHGRGNTWDFPAERDPQIYFEGKVLPQVRELLSGYGPLALIWFDTPGMLSEEQVTELRRLVKRHQPSCLINSRIGHAKGDYLQTSDNAIPIQVHTKTKWEVPATLNDTWGYKKNDQNWKDPADLIAKLADIAAKGGNYLLNVGPDAEGVIPPASQKILRTVGKWLAANGEAIYGTMPSPFYLAGITWRVTVKPGRLYLHLLEWPGTRFRLEGLETELKQAYLLATGLAVPFKQTGTTVELELPDRPVDPYNTVVVLVLADPVPRVAPGYRAEDIPDRVELWAWTARLHGEEIRYDRASRSATRFVKVDSPANELRWYPYGALAGDYEVELTYACENRIAGSRFRVGVHPSNTEMTQSLAGKIEPTGGRFLTRRLPGALTLGPADLFLSFSLPEDDRSAGMRLQKLTLIRRK